MREIKFRAWDKIENKMFNVHRLSYDFGWQIKGDLDSDLHSPIESKECVLMQFTGLKDKNGVEIYEGDIIIDVANKKEGWKSSIIFSECGFWCSNEHPCRELFELYERERLEVIGNIYENPDLVKKCIY